MFYSVLGSVDEKERAQRVLDKCKFFIRGQLGSVPPQWSVTYRFVIAAIAMALIALIKGDSLNVGRRGLPRIHPILLELQRSIPR